MSDHAVDRQTSDVLNFDPEARNGLIFLKNVCAHGKGYVPAPDEVYGRPRRPEGSSLSREEFNRVATQKALVGVYVPPTPEQIRARDPQERGLSFMFNVVSEGRGYSLKPGEWYGKPAKGNIVDINEVTVCDTMTPERFQMLAADARCFGVYGPREIRL